MSAQAVAILSTGLVTSVGLTAEASCAAIRAKVSNPSETRVKDLSGDWIMGNAVALDQPWRGRAKLVKMAALVIEECLSQIPRRDWPQIPLLLCVAERERAGRLDGIDRELFAEIQSEFDLAFADSSMILPNGRVCVGTALGRARDLLSDNRAPHVLIVSTDSLLNASTLSQLVRNDRILTGDNSNGFVPGEGAAAILVGSPKNGFGVRCTGIGFATEPAAIGSGLPLRGEGMARAIRAALVESERDIGSLDFRVTDLSGEQYYFKEAALALSKVLRVRKESFALWHPAECIGESGSVSSLSTLIVAESAFRNGYAPGPGALCHAASDDGKRTAVVLQFASVQ